MELDPQLRRIADHPPPGETSESWVVLPLPLRLRLLALGHYLIELPADDRAALRSVPPWMTAGPELGYPEEWFNPDGWLLPKYRPGGGCYREYLRARHMRRFWQVAVDGHQLWLHRFVRRWGCLGPAVLGAAVYLALVFAMVRLPSRLPDPWDMLGATALMLIGAPILLLLRYLLASFSFRLTWACAERKLRQRVDCWATPRAD